jgi:hypothetical protein
MHDSFCQSVAVETICMKDCMLELHVVHLICFNK